MKFVATRQKGQTLYIYSFVPINVSNRTSKMTLYHVSAKIYYRIQKLFVPPKNSRGVSKLFHNLVHTTSLLSNVVNGTYNIN